jgi:hypothetical protein
MQINFLKIINNLFSNNELKKNYDIIQDFKMKTINNPSGSGC